MMVRNIKFGLLLVIVSLFFVTSSFSQGKTVTLRGHVTDQQGNPANNATLLARNLDTNFTAKTITDESGQYIFRNMPYGRYDIKLVGEGGRGGDIIVSSEFPMDGFYDLDFNHWQKGVLQPVLSSVTVLVINVNDEPIEHATWSTRRGDTAPAVLDSSGFGYGNFKFGTYEFTISASGYKSQTKIVKLKSSNRKIFVFRLRKK